MSRPAHNDAQTAASHPRTALAIGERLGADLQVFDLIGEGGTAAVYRAYHAVLLREVAIKVCTVRGEHAREAHLRLIREAKMCASIRDPRVPRVYGLDTLDDGTPYLVMEKVEGEALSRTLRRWRVPVRYACEIGCALLDTLDSVHRAKLVHRDVKPSNLLVDLRPEAHRRMVLIDFGIGKIMDQESADLDLTKSGALVGTPHYMPPEQIAGVDVDGRSDLYAAGVVLYEMLTGRTPFTGNNVMEVLAAVLRDPVPPIDALRAGLPPSLCRVVEKAIARAPDQRFDSARSMRLALAAATKDVMAMGAHPALEALALELPAPQTGAGAASMECTRSAGEHATVDSQLQTNPRRWMEPGAESRSAGGLG
jgi:serine/threonine-protein kinase